MDVKEAVAKAKSYVSDLFRDDAIDDVRLEEIEYDEERDWLVTVSFLWRYASDGFAAKASLSRPRSYKVVRISKRNDNVVSVKDRQLAEL